nr:hypothetical protein [Tanacetum cinerariifolium]
MSSSDSAVTYTSISSEDVPFRGIRFFGMEQPDSPEAAPQSPIQTPLVPQDEDEQDEHVLLAEEQSLPPVDSPTAESPGYVADSDPEEDPEEYKDDESEDGPTLRIASTQTLIDAVTVALPSPSLPPPLYIPPHVDRRDHIPKTELPPRKKSCLFALGPKYEVGESSTARPIGGRGIDYGFVSTLGAEARRRGIREVGYGIRDTWVDPAEAVPEIEPMTLGEVNTRVTELAELHEHDTQDLYALLEDAQDSRTRISQRVTMDS